MRSPSLEELPASPEGKSGWPWTEETILELDTDRLDENLPRISIVSPSFNQWRFLEECIRSAYSEVLSCLRWFLSLSLLYF